MQQEDMKLLIADELDCLLHIYTNMQHQDIEMLRIDEVSKKWKLSEGTIWNLINTGELNAIKVRGCTCVPKSELIKYMNNKIEGGYHNG